MENLYMFLLRFVIVLLLMAGSRAALLAQTTLFPGDIAFVRYTLPDDGPSGPQDDEFTFILLKEITAGTVIYFTDYGWTSENRFQEPYQSSDCGGGNTGTRLDGIVKWTADQAYSVGQQVRIKCRYTPSASVGTAVGERTSTGATFYMSLVTGGDEIFAYQGSFNSPAFIAGISMRKNWAASLSPCEFVSAASVLPAALTNSNVAILGSGNNAFSAIYNCSTTSGTVATLRAAINNPNNWTVDDTDVTPLPDAFRAPIPCPITVLATQITAQPTNQTICTGSSTTFTVTATNATTYQWQLFNSGTWTNLSNTSPYSGVATSTLAISNVSGLNGRQYRVVVTGATSATSNAATLTVNAPPQNVSLAASGPLSCTNASVTLTANNTTSGVTYAFRGPSGTVTSAGNTAAVSQAGTYTLVVTAPGGCTASATTTVTGDTQPPQAIGLSVNSPLSCSVTSVTLTATTSTPGVSYAFSGPGVMNTVGNRAVVNQSGTYSVNVTAPNGCTATTTTTVTGNTQAPQGVSLTASGPLSCITTTVTLTAVSTTPSVTYTFAGPTGIVGSTGATAIVSQVGTYTVTATTSGGCTATATTTVSGDTQTPQAVSLTPNDQLTCSATTITLTAASSTTGVGYAFSGPSVVNSTGAMAVINQPGTYSVVVTAPNGCTASTAANVVANTQAPQNLTLTASGLLGCAITTVTLTANSSTPDVTYAFRGPMGVVSSTGAAAIVGQPGTYTVTATTPGGCTATATTVVNGDTQLPQAVSLIANSELTCSTPTTTLTASSTTPGVTYAFSGPGVISTAANFATVNQAGSYSVVATAPSGCTATASTTVIGSTETPQNLNLIASGPLNCTSTVTLTASSTTPGVRYVFTGPSGVVTSAGTTATISQVGTYTVTATTPDGCTATATTIVIGDSQTPQVNLMAIGVLDCVNTTVTLSAFSNTPATSFSFSGPGIVSTTASTAIVNQASSYSVVATTPNGCTALSSTTVPGNIDAPRNLSLTASSPLSCSTTTITLTAASTSTLVPDTYEFTGPGIVSRTTNTVTVNLAGTYSVIATAPTGCTAAASTVVMGSTSSPSAPTLSASATSVTNAPISVTATGCSGTLNWSVLGGTGTAAGNVYTMVAPGSYTLTATCTINTCTSAASSPLSVSINAAATGPLVLLAPLYNCQTGAISFRTSGGNGSLIEYFAIGITPWTTNPNQTVELGLRGDPKVITLKARQSSTSGIPVEVSYAFDLPAACSQPPVNQRPVLTTSISNQTAIQEQLYDFTIPINTFTDPEGQPLTYSVSGLPAGLTAPQTIGTPPTISGTTNMTGVSTITVTVIDPSGLTASTSFGLTITTVPPPRGLLVLLAPTYDCATGAITFNTAGGNGTTVEYMAIGITPWTTNPNQTVDSELRADPKVVTLMARQSGTVVTYSFDLPNACGSNPINQPPVVSNPIGTQTALQGQPYSFIIPANTFMDPEGQPLTYSANGLPAGLSLSGMVISGTPSVEGTFVVTVVAQDAGGLTKSLSFSLRVNPQTPPPTGDPLALIAPLYNCETGAITFRVTGGNGLAIEYMAIGITPWATNPNQTVEPGLRGDPKVITLMARQSSTTGVSAVVTYSFDLAAACTTAPVNQPPVVKTPIGSQTAVQGQAYSFSIPASTFTDPEGQPLTYSVNGLPAELTFSGMVISGTPSTTGVSTVTVTVIDAGGLTASTSFGLTITTTLPVSGALTMIAPLYNCATGAFTFRTTGGNGTPIQYRAVPGITDWTTNPNHFLDSESRTMTDTPPFLLEARQAGVYTTLTWSRQATCNVSSRLAAKEPAESLQVTVLGNPLVGETLQMEIRGHRGQPLQLQVTDAGGHIVADELAQPKASVEKHSVSIRGQSGGILLLRASTPTQTCVVKLIKQ